MAIEQLFCKTGSISGSSACWTSLINTFWKRLILAISQMKLGAKSFRVRKLKLDDKFILSNRYQNQLKTLISDIKLTSMQAGVSFNSFFLKHSITWVLSSNSSSRQVSLRSTAHAVNSWGSRSRSDIWSFIGDFKRFHCRWGGDVYLLLNVKIGGW